MSNSQIVKILCFEQYAKFVLMHCELAQKQHQQGQVYVTGLSQFKLMFKCILYTFHRIFLQNSIFLLLTWDKHLNFSQDIMKHPDKQLKSN